MPSPFPGMDPYLEGQWGDVHTRLIVYMTEMIEEQLPADLRARVEERVVLEAPEGIGGGLIPDVRVVEYGPRRSPASGEATSVCTPAEPLILEAEPALVKQRFIEIIDVGSGNRVVTVVDVFSPTNKLAGDGRQDYQSKQAKLLSSTTNLVEIDLVRQGKHLAAVPLAHIPLGRRGPYLACLRRATTPGKAEVYPIALSQPLPTIKIPLRAQDKDVLLDLQALITRAYQRGRYEGTLDYAKDPQPPLSGLEAEWADRLLRDKGLRKSRPRRTRRRPTSES